jgi:DNA-binding LacI/PurR family transcriptional regulator/CheY-like chemotaxis protein
MEEAVNCRDARARLNADGELRTLRSGRRLTVALLADYMSHFLGGYETQLRLPIAARCEAMGINLLLVYGGAIEHPTPDSKAQNAIFELIHPDRVDGVILLSTSLSSYAGPGKVKQLVARLHGVPCCSVGIPIEDVPSVVIDNRESMEAVVEHVIVAHARRRLVFIGGTADNVEAQLRRDAFCGVLRRHSIPIEAERFENGNFWSRGAQDAILRILSRGVEFDAVVCANDNMAQAVAGILAERGIRVPWDVSLTGFDDIFGARLMSPPLTTAAQPFDAMAAQALHMVIEQALGHEVPMLMELSAKLVVRRSCGCRMRTGSERTDEPPSVEPNAHAHLVHNRTRIRERLCEVMRDTSMCRASGVVELSSALESELSGRRGAFLEALETLGSAISRNPELMIGVQHAIAFLRDELRPFTSEGIEELWHQARDELELALVRGQVSHRAQLEDGYLRLLESSENVSRSLSRETFRASLLKSLPLLRIENAAISRFVDDHSGELELMAGLVGRSLATDLPERFPAKLLMPYEIFPEDRRHTSLVLPLVVDSRPLGVAVFEYNGDTVGQTMVRTQIGAALGSIRLHREVIEKSMQHERSLQERLAATKRMEALSVLAGGVAHDLNNALGPIVALPDVILAELDALLDRRGATEIRRDIETVKLAALRAAQTIKDLLTLGRQGRTAKEPIDVARLVRGCVSLDVLPMLRTKKPNVVLHVEVPCSKLLIHASESHVLRALTNLICNAFEAIPDDGRVTLSASRARVEAPLHAFETIDPGDYVTIRVTDSGDGVSVQELHRIFEPFFSTKRTDEHSGSGLGLAIVHGVIKEHDGFVDVTSRPGSGTAFTLYFPEATLPAVERAQVSVSPVCGNGRILIVDDEPIQLRTGKRVLSRLGYQVDTLESGRQASERFLQAAASSVSPYDLVILDMLLNEEHDGLSLFEQIRNVFPQQKAIVVSGHAPTERAEAALQRGLAWLAKPYTADALARAVEAALAERESVGSQRITCRRLSIAPNRMNED